MIQKLIHRLLLRRHFWRHATFSEVAELYTSSLLRRLAISMSSAFLSVFLVQNGYSIVFIAGFWAVYFLLKMLLSFPTAMYVSKFGPKHGILLSNILYIPAMAAFTFVPEWGMSAIVITGLLQAVSTTLYSICYAIDFSKVKSVEHAGKEIGYMHMIEKIATGLSPLIGGFLAFWAGPEATMWTAAVLFAVAAIPLMQTGEPPISRQKFVFRGFPWRLTWHSLVANLGVGFDFVASGMVWLLFVATVILGTSNNDVYAKLGVLLSVVLIAALAVAYTYGRLIDHRRGRELLIASVIANSIVHLVRPSVNSMGVVAGVNVANEVSTTGYAMAFTRGAFDTADRSGHRITYLSCLEAMAALGASIGATVFMLLVAAIGDEPGMRMFFYITAVFVLIIAFPKFALYRK